MTELSLGRNYKLILGKEKERGIQNPAWEYVKRVPPDDIYAKYDGRHHPTMSEIRGTRFIGHRSRVTTRWTWAIPSPDILEFIVKALDGRPVVEIGAGNGYWAWMLSQYGVDVKAYDLHPVGHPDSWFTAKHLKEMGWDDEEPKEFFPVTQGGVEMLSLLPEPERVLFLCWPPYDDSMAYDAVKLYKGDTVIYIGERSGGCNADWQFWSLMEGDDSRWSTDDKSEPAPDQEWERVAGASMIQWSGIHDDLMVYRRK